MIKQNFPPGWDEDRVRQVLAHYEHQTEDEAVAEDERFRKRVGRTIMEIPVELLPVIRQVLALYEMKVRVPVLSPVG